MGEVALRRKSEELAKLHGRVMVNELLRALGVPTLDEENKQKLKRRQLRKIHEE